jgi:Flp pilus assembly protein TadG
MPLLSKQRGQATVEFALVTPLVLACAGLLVGTTVTCLQYIALHDTARIAVRAAITADDPAVAAQNAIQNRNISVSVSEDIVHGYLTVTAKRTGGLWWFGKLLPSGILSQSVTMMREAPIVLG